MVAPPAGCRWCGLAQRDHFQRWSRAAGWHLYIPPTQDQIKERMKARRTLQGQRASLVITDEAVNWPVAERTDMSSTDTARQEGGIDLRAAFDRVDARHQPTTTETWVNCPAHQKQWVHALITMCSMCATRPVTVCANDVCPTWPCPDHLALHGETVDTCTHKGDNR
ncbi:hypothetical protein HII36_05630 [Nonomuraea sp. NN258]|uniref:hypothetical protein n=1 Tax=Nonomuraea antri TaxID=2730852 RepID=UPI00156969A1|nr:hypothetical protein [Nonomuraea antri]NRQ31319.1 hypothetical protein [Nonomuraea antri]